LILHTFTFRHCCWRLLAALVLMSAVLSPVWAELLDSAKEYQIKAAYVTKLSNFISWPDERFSDNADTIRICIFGEDPFKNSIDLAAQRVKVKGRGVAIQRLSRNADGTACHIVFISQSEQRSIPFILGSLAGHPILTVSDTQAFLEQGGMVEFYTNVQRQIRLQLAPEAILETDMKVSANLLAIGRKRD